MISEKRVKLGYARVRHIRLYCEKFHLLSNAFPDCDSYTIEGIAGTAGKPRRVRVPLSVVQMLRHEVALQKILRSRCGICASLHKALNSCPRSSLAQRWLPRTGFSEYFVHV